MNARIPAWLVLFSLAVLATPLGAAEPDPGPITSTAIAAAPVAAENPATAAAPEATAPNPVKVEAVITPWLYGFDYFDGVGADRTHFLERYEYREDLSGDTRSGVFPDLDLNLRISDPDRELFSFERRGFGQHNHRGAANLNVEPLDLSASYSHYRSATGGIDYLYSPNQVPGALPPAPYTVFNDDANRFDYHIDRTRYGAGFKLKPALLGGMASVGVDYQGYSREGNKFGPMYLLAPGLNSADRWRGINVNIDEHMNRAKLTFAGSARKLFEFAYDVSLEEFINSASELQLERDVLAPAGVNTAGLPSERQRISSVFYVPDAKLASQGLRLTTYLGDRAVVAAGYRSALLTQESYSAREVYDAHLQGEIDSDNAYITITGNLAATFSAEAYVKYYRRENNSTYPDLLINSAVGPGQQTAPRINSIDSLDYGLSANWRPRALGSNITLGWRRLDRERDLTFGTVVGEDIFPAQSLYREQTLSDELYLRYTARPAAGITLRLTPSYTWADQTGLVSEPAEALAVKAMASYAAPAGWLVSGFYDYRDRRNDNNTWTDAGGVTPQTYNQSVNGTLNSAGVSVNLVPLEKLNTFASLFWVQDDFSSYYFRTNVQRWDPTVVFTLIDEPDYLIDTYSLSLGADWQATDKLKLSAGYSYSRSQGEVASGTALTELQTATGTVDARIDNRLQSISLGADYALHPRATLHANYFYDYYEDWAYSLLTGGVHTLAVGLSLTF